MNLKFSAVAEKEIQAAGDYFENKKPGLVCGLLKN
jgi:hypothetical protein